MVRQGTQHHTMGMDQTTINRKQNNEEKIEVDRTYTEESCKKNHNNHMEPPGKKRRGRQRKTWLRDCKQNKADGKHWERQGEDHGQ